MRGSCQRECPLYRSAGACPRDVNRLKQDLQNLQDLQDEGFLSRECCFITVARGSVPRDVNRLKQDLQDL